MTAQAAFNQTLGATAHWTASVRALESEREDRLFSDPWAAALAGPEGQAWITSRTPDSVLPIVLRTRYFDDFLQRITREHSIRQVVLLAAGLDTRAFRLPWPAQTHLFELDQPAVLAYKEQVLQAAGAQPGCARTAIPADLTQPWQQSLVAGFDTAQPKGFNPAQPSGWLLEGFLFYLPNESLTRILTEVSALAAPGSWLGFDIINTHVLTSPWTKAWVEMQARSGAAWVGTLDDPLTFLAGLGWKAGLTQAGAEDANHGRWRLPVIPTRMPDMPHNWYVTAFKE